MSYIIYTSSRDRQLFTSHKAARIIEAFYIGMRINYFFIYPNGDIKQVKFKQIPMTTITRLEENINSIKKQMRCLSENKNINNQDRTELRRYYEDKLNYYTTVKDALIKNLDVKAKIFDPK